MALPEGFIQQLRDSNDIIDVAQGYVELKRSGRTHSCRCPFHSDKSPSCHFYTDTQSFFCFGCGAGGDVITFIRLIENLDYMDSVRFLAQRAGIAMPQDQADGSARTRQRIYEMNREAGKFYHQLLFSPEGKAALDYLTGRGLTIHTIRRFGLGFAPDEFHRLHFHLRGMGFSDFEMADAGLLVQNNNKFYDKYRNRPMFPIFDTRGNIVGFGGRAMGDAKPKYLNTDETLVFQKRDMLYALNYAKNSKADFFILCEGYMDVIAMHQAGFDSAVASLGTAITPAQARLLSRMGKKEVILSYDSDEAGQKAASRGINIFAEAGVKARVLKIDGAKDPDEFITKFGADAFRLLLEKSGNAIDFELDKLAVGLDMNSEDGKSTYIKKAVQFLAGITNSLDREVYMSRAARTADIPVEAVRTAIKGEIARRGKRNEREQNRQLIHPRNDDRINPQSYKFPREEKAEQGIISCLYNNPDLLGFIEERLKSGFVTEFNGRVYKVLVNMVKSGINPDISLFNEGFESAEMGRIMSIINNKLFAYDKSALEEYIKTLNDYNESSAVGEVATMTDEDLLRLAEKQKEKRK